jgi:hypothetical protein
MEDLLTFPGRSSSKHSQIDTLAYAYKRHWHIIFFEYLTCDLCRSLVVHAIANMIPTKSKLLEIEQK